MADLQEQGVSFEFETSEEYFEKHKVILDPKMINVALHHFFQNMTKYVCHNTSMQIVLIAQDDVVELYVKMMSLKIESEELDNIFERGVSGKNVGNLAGQGIGMFVIKSALEHFCASVRIEPDHTITTTVDGKEYTLNNFIFSFSVSKDSII